tara:strand:- start:120 stop:326 length:207 start_codon:yes stop_codon:yes gene_type:complete
MLLRQNLVLQPRDDLVVVEQDNPRAVVKVKVKVRRVVKVPVEFLQRAERYWLRELPRGGMTQVKVKER